MKYFEVINEGTDYEWKVFYKDIDNKIYHREDGPAYIAKNGTKKWYKNDELHREDGPAVERSGGRKEYWLNGKYFYEKDYWATIRFGGFV